VKEVVPVADNGKLTVETLQRLLDAFNAHDLDAVMGFFTDDCVLEMPRGPHRGCSPGRLPRGEPIEVRGCDLFEFRGDKVARKDSYWKLVER
jgi:hypothetical protein